MNLFKSVFFTSIALVIILLPQVGKAEDLNKNGGDPYIIVENNIAPLTALSSLLDVFPGPLKSYKTKTIANYTDGRTPFFVDDTGENMIGAACYDAERQCNIHMLLAFLELRTHALSSGEVSMTTVVNNFPLDPTTVASNKYIEHINKYFALKLAHWGYYLTDLSTDKIYDPSRDLPLKLKDGTTVFIPKGSSRGGYIVLTALANLAKNNDEYARWTGIGPDSFLSTYQMILDKAKAVSGVVYSSDTGSQQYITSSTESSSAFFLEKKPFDGSKKVNSFFDHDLDNGKFLRFDSFFLPMGTGLKVLLIIIIMMGLIMGAWVKLRK